MRDSHEWLMSDIVAHEDNECVRCGALWFTSAAESACRACVSCEGQGGWSSWVDNSDVDVCSTCRGTGLRQRPRYHRFSRIET